MRSPLKTRRRTQAGFSLLELTISVLILVIVMGAVFTQINNIQKNTKTESLKLDLTQESREFADHFARDLHMSGYPAPRIYQNYSGLTDTATATGLVYASTTDLVFEGDVYGDGTVYRVEYRYFPSDANDANCPCVRRSVAKKTTSDPLTGYPNPVYYTEVQNVIDPTGMTEQIFTYFQATGALVDVNSNACSSNTPPSPASGCVDIENNTALIKNIDAIKVNLSTRSRQYDPQTGLQNVNSISTIAELEN